MEDARTDLMDSIEWGLGIMGAGVKEAIYFYLRDHSVNRDEIPEKLQQFRKVLQELLGYGARVVEKLVVKAYAQKAGIPLATIEGKDLGDIAELAKYREKSGSLKQTGQRRPPGDAT